MRMSIENFPLKPIIGSSLLNRIENILTYTWLWSRIQKSKSRRKTLRTRRGRHHNLTEAEVCPGEQQIAGRDACASRLFFQHLDQRRVATRGQTARYCCENAIV
jgi:hypothetical protein